MTQPPRRALPSAPPARLRSLAAAAAAALVLAAAACDSGTGPASEAPGPCEGPVAGGLCLRLMAEGLEFPLHLTAPPGADWGVVVEQPGLIHVIDDGGLDERPFLDLRDRVTYPHEQGVLGLEFDPDFAANGTFYVHYTNLEGESQVSRFRVGDDPKVADPASEERLLAIPRVHGLHNAGRMQFGPEGMLWISTGDGYDPSTAQDLSILRGSILRIDVRDGGPYRIPPDNPFVDDPDALPEIWMYGFRNPWRFALDLEEGLAWIPDVGHERREELNVVPWHSPGANFGWARLEGSLCMEEGCSPEGTILPVLEYPHDGTGIAIIGGTVYRGDLVPELRGTYFYGDLAGFVRSLRYVDGEVTDERSWWNGEIGQIIALAEGPGRELWITTFDGKVYRAEPAP